MNIRKASGAWSPPRTKNLQEIVSEIRFSIEIGFAQFANILEECIDKIHTCSNTTRNAGPGEPINEENFQMKKLSDLNSNFRTLMSFMDQIRQSSMSTTNELIESFSDNKPVVQEESRVLDSNRIQTDFIHHDFEIGGLINGIAYVPKQQFIITGHNSGFVNVWGKNTLQIVHQFKAHDSPITTIAFLEKDKLLFTGSLDGKVKVYKPRGFPIFKHILTLNLERKKVFGLVSVPKQDIMLISCKEGYIYILDTAKLKILKTLRRPGPLDNNILYIEELELIVVACLGNDTVELLSPKTFKTLDVIHNKFMVQTLKGIQYNPIRNELLVCFAYKIIKIYKFDKKKVIEDRDLYIDKPFPSKIDFIDEDYMVFASLSDRLDFVRIGDGQPVKSVNLGFTFSDFLLLREERRIIIFPYQSPETSIGIVEY